ncbi:MAG: metallopeptidase TldD-related protein [Pseudobdellovibrionaceae bacterium]
MSFQSEIRQWWDGLTQKLFNELKSGEVLGLSLHAEDTEFVRFNACLVRQNTNVKQIAVDFQLQTKNSNLSYGCGLTGHLESDFATALSFLNEMRFDLAALPSDPLFVPLVNNGKSNKVYKGETVPSEKIVTFLEQNQKEMDLAGIFCQGPVIKANKNSLHQDHWFETESFYFDYSLFDKDRAVKGNYSGQIWHEEKFETQITQSKNFLSLMKKEKKSLAPGPYKVYLAPAATAELFSIMGWDGMSEAAYRKGTNGLQKAARGEVSLSSKFTLLENFTLGLTQSFNSLGEVSADVIPVFEKGVFQQFLTSTKSSIEYNTTSNFASIGEYPRSPEILPGNLDEKDVFKVLGTGIYLSNLHYLNWSDRQTGRITGMTRYACFWVENGEIISPIQDLRFDESLLNIFGAGLLDLTSTAETFTSTSSYERRDIGGCRAPGILVSPFQFTL